VTAEGERKWVFRCPYDALDSPLAIGPDNTIYAMQRVGYLYAINPDGAIKWTFSPLQKQTYGAPIVGPDNVVYFVHGSGTFYALNPDGSIKWSYTDNTSKTTPVLGEDGILYMGTSDGHILSVGSEGKLKDNIIIGDSFTYAPKLTPDGTLYIYSDNGFLYAVQTTSYGYPAEPCWPCIFGSNRNINRLIEKDISTIEDAVNDSSNEMPEVFTLSVNRPNPFNPSTTIQYCIPADVNEHVSLKIYDIRGALVKTLAEHVNNPGIYSVVWHGTDTTGNIVSSGIYIYQLQAGDFTKSNKMMLMR